MEKGKKEDYIFEFDRNYGANAVNGVLERNFYDFCKVLNKTEFEGEELEQATKVLNDYCKNLAVKHLQEKGYDITFLIDLLLCGGDSVFYNYSDFTL